MANGNGDNGGEEDDKRERWTDTQKIVALSLVWGFIVVLTATAVLMIDHVDPPPAMLAVFTTLSGGLMTQANNVVNYFFGSNKQSAAKDATIKNQTDALASMAPAVTK